MGVTTDRDRETAAKALRYQLGAEDVDRVAEALAAERERVLAPVLAVAEELQGTAEICGGKVNGYVFADRIRRAAQDGERP